MGCGWIGEAFAAKLLREGHEIYATTTDSEKYQRLQAAGIFAIKANFEEEIHLKNFPPEVDFVLNSIPAVKRLDWARLDARFTAVKQLLIQLRYRKHIYLSSIGVYPDQDGIYSEESSIASEGNKLLFAEELMLELHDTVVYRLGGLFGEQRIFAKYFQSKVCTTGAQIANFIHQTDVVNLLDAGFKQRLSALRYNLVAPDHPTKKDVIRASAAKYDFELPSAFLDENSFQKLVIGDKISNELAYTFAYPSPLDF
ncbi:NAD(P)-dependent oxidoreductase [Sphingobacterium griseoflavum]|uniref:NAD(P)-dependent oxidoreductase n=1 Tax=Sphingobacterium griseoflavum TaxID=1474952 RepID=A0ABQ3HUT0_9SPHI|nr:NAD(P)-dependent oxidoreductase [Sphingobacterium griseoflavum]